MCERVHQAAGAEQDLSRVLGQPSQVPFALCLPGCCSLSVQCGKCSAWGSVTRYHIHRLDNGWLYISSWLTFPILHNLVDHYSGNAPPAPQHLEQCVGRCIHALKGGRGKMWQPVPPLPRCAQPGGQGCTLLIMLAPCPEFSEGLCCRVCEPCPMEGPRAAPASTVLKVLRKPSLH